MFKAPLFDIQSTEPSIVDTSPIASPTSVSDHAPGTISTLVSNGKNGANSNDASSVGAIIGIPLGSVLIGTVISIIIVVYIRFVRSDCSFITFVVNCGH